MFCRILVFLNQKMTEAVTRRCSVKKEFLESSKNTQESTYARVSFLINFILTSNFIKKETLAQVFSCEFYEISKNTFSYRTPQVAAFGRQRCQTETLLSFCQKPVKHLKYHITSSLPFKRKVSRFKKCLIIIIMSESIYSQLMVHIFFAYTFWSCHDYGLCLSLGFRLFWTSHLL